MGVTVRRHAQPQELWDRAGALLLAREAFHTVMLGVLGHLRSQPSEQRGDALLLSVEQDGRVVAATVRTPPRALLLSAGIPPDAIGALVEHLDTHRVDVPSVNGALADAEAFAGCWAQRRGGAVRTAMRLRLFACSGLAPPRTVAGRLRDAAPADRDLLVAWLDAFTAEALPHEPPGGAAELVDTLLAERPSRLVAWEDGGEPVSVAGYSLPPAGSPRITSVYTPPDLRGRGYASGCVGALTQRLLDDEHARVLLFSDLANATSNRIYTRMGYRPLGEFAQLEMGAGRPQ